MELEGTSDVAGHRILLPFTGLSNVLGFNELIKRVPSLASQNKDLLDTKNTKVTSAIDFCCIILS